MLLWTVNEKRGNGITFSRTVAKGDATWVGIYDWCNVEFNSNNWEFWYSINSIDNTVNISFSFSQEYDAIQFQLKWGQCMDWVEVVYSKKDDTEMSQIRHWLKTVLYPISKGSYHVGSTRAWFMNNEDAVFFKMVWV